MKPRKSHPIIVLIFSLLILFAGSYILRLWMYPGYVAASFEREAWASADAQHRGYMAESLLADQHLIGMTREQIIDLLGEPDEVSKDLEIFRYHLGYMDRNPKTPFQLDLYLWISFDADGKAKSTGIAD